MRSSRGWKREPNLSISDLTGGKYVQGEDYADLAFKRLLGHHSPTRPQQDTIRINTGACLEHMLIYGRAGEQRTVIAAQRRCSEGGQFAVDSPRTGRGISSRYERGFLGLFIARGEAGFESTGLRQGDILEGIPFPLLDDSKLRIFVDIAGDWDFKSVDSLTPKRHKERQDDQWVTAQVPIRFGYCAVMANCCDLELREGRIQAPAVALARLHPIGEIQKDSARLASLRANKDPRNQDDPGYIDFFYLEGHELLQNQEWKVHFNQVVSVPTVDLKRLLSRKILQLDDRSRMKFKIKLGFTYARVNKEELEAGLENPWEAEGLRQNDQPLSEQMPPEH